MMNDVSKLGPLWVSQLRQTVTERRNRAAESLLTINPDGDYAKHHQMLIDAADAMLAAAPAAPVAAPAPSALTDEDIDAIWQTMPGGPAGWLKSFGYQQFAREIEAAILDSAPDPFAGIAADFAADCMLTTKEPPCDA